MSKTTEKPSAGSDVQITEGPPTRGEIEMRAHEIYVEHGSLPGQDVGDWLQAERELLEKYEKARLKANAAAV